MIIGLLSIITTMLTINDIRDAVLEIAPDYGVSSAYLFGSYARGEQQASSDVDLVLELGRPLGFKRSALMDALEERMGVPVDVVFGESQLYMPVREQFNNDKVMLYEL